MRSAQAERERLFAEARRVEVLLRGALGIVEESVHPVEVAATPAEDPADEPAAEAAVEPPAAPDETEPPEAVVVPPDPWPNREDTAEFPSLMNIRTEVDPDQL